MRLGGLRAEADELALTDATDIVIAADAGRVLRRAACDLQDYLAVSMGVAARLRPVENLREAMSEGRGNIVLATRHGLEADLREGNAPRGWRIDCDANVLVTGYDECGAMQGSFRLEDAMNMRRAPFVKKGTIAGGPLFSPRMVHSGYGLDDYPTAHIAAIAHAGMDAILVFVKGVDTTPRGYLDFNELCWRAAEYGVDVYAYSYLKSELHPDDPGAAAFYDRVYGSDLQKLPLLQGHRAGGRIGRVPVQGRADHGNLVPHPHRGRSARRQAQPRVVAVPRLSPVARHREEVRPTVSARRRHRVLDLQLGIRGRGGKDRAHRQPAHGHLAPGDLRDVRKAPDRSGDEHVRRLHAELRGTGGILPERGEGREKEGHPARTP